MLNEYQQQVLFLDDVRIPLLYAAGISAFYYYFTKNLLSSAHGALIIIAFLYSAIFSGFTEYGAASYWYWPLFGFLLFALSSLIYSIREFSNKRWVHLLHLGTLASAAFILFVGGMAISHDWL